MSPAKKDRKVQSISGNSFPEFASGRIGAARFSSAIAAALHREFGGKGSAIKKTAKLTTANHRAVKNWFEARNGPSGEFLVLLCRHSDQVLEVVLSLAGRGDLIAAMRLLNTKEKLRELVAMMDQLSTQNKYVP